MTIARESTTIWKGEKLYRIQSEIDSVKGVLAFFLSIIMLCFSVKDDLDIYHRIFFRVKERYQYCQNSSV